MTLSQIQTKIYDRLNMPGTADPTVVRRILGFINDRHKAILGKRGFERLRRRNLTFSSTANYPYAALPQAIDQILNIVDRTNSRPLELMTPEDLRYRDPAQTASGSNPYGYVPFSLNNPVARDPDNASTIFVKSDAAGDITQKLYIEGVLATGGISGSNVTLTGTTAVALTGSFVSITKCYLDGACTGNITVTEDSGAGNQLAYIPIGKTSAKYAVVQLWPTPTAISPFYADCIVSISDLANPNEEPLFPDLFHEILVYGACADEYAKREKYDGVKFYEAKVKEIDKDLLSYVRKDGGINTNMSRQRQFSHLGANFPAGS